MAFNPNMANREVADLIFCDYKTKAPILNLDFANVTTTNITANRTYAKGGAGAPNRVGFDGEMAGTLQVDTQITPMKLYGIVSGSGVNKVAKYLKREVLTISSGKATLTDTPVIGSVHAFAEADDCGTPLEITVAAKEVTVTGATGNIIAYYLTVPAEDKTHNVKFSSKIFPKAMTIYGKTPWKTEDEEIVEMKLTYFKAQPQMNVNLAFSNSGDPTSMQITFDLYANEDLDIYDMTIVDEEDGVTP